MPIPAPSFNPPTQGPQQPMGQPMGPPPGGMAGGAPPGGMGEEQITKENITAQLEQVPIEKWIEFLKQPIDTHMPTLMDMIQQSPELQGMEQGESDALAFQITDLLYEAILAYVPEKTGQDIVDINPEFEDQQNYVPDQPEGSQPIPAPQMGGPNAQL